MIRSLVAIMLVATLCTPTAAHAFSCAGGSGEVKLACEGVTGPAPDAGKCNSIRNSQWLKAMCYGMAVSSTAKCKSTLIDAGTSSSDAIKACDVFQDVRGDITAMKKPSRSCSVGDTALDSFCEAVGKQSTSCNIPSSQSHDKAACTKVAGMLKAYFSWAVEHKASLASSGALGAPGPEDAFMTWWLKVKSDRAAYVSLSGMDCGKLTSRSYERTTCGVLTGALTSCPTMGEVSTSVCKTLLASRKRIVADAKRLALEAEALTSEPEPPTDNDMLICMQLAKMIYPDSITSNGKAWVFCEDDDARDMLFSMVDYR